MELDMELDSAEFPCRELNDELILCHDQYKDWRRCQELLGKFKECLAQYKKNN